MRRSLATLTASALAAAALLAGCNASVTAPGDDKAGADGKASPGAATAPAPTEAAASARAFAEALYARYTADPDFNPIVTRDGVWDPAMLALMARVDAAQEASGDAIFDFEPLCQCQDNTGLIARADEARATGADAATVPVQLSYPAGEAGRVELKLVRVAGKWRVHDIASKDVPSYSAHLESALAEQ